MSILSLIAIVIASLFTGAALYINLVEQPARLALPGRAMLVQWRESYNRAFRWQGGLAFAGGVAGLSAWLAGAPWPLLASAILMIANWPYTLAIVMPVNRALKRLSLDDADVDPEQLLRRWSRVHGWRGVLGALAIGFAVAGAL